MHCVGPEPKHQHGSGALRFKTSHIKLYLFPGRRQLKRFGRKVRRPSRARVASPTERWTAQSCSAVPFLPSCGADGPEYRGDPARAVPGVPVDMLVDMQRQVPKFQKALKIAGVPQLQIQRQGVDVPAVMQRQVPTRVNLRGDVLVMTQRQATTIQNIQRTQKIDRTTDAVQGGGCASRDAKTVSVNPMTLQPTSAIP